MREVYLDHAATTPVDPRVLEEMLPFFSERFGNASSVHGPGRVAREAVDVARERVAALIGAGPDEIVFTGGGTEADNFALLGCMAALSGRREHLVTTAIEHHAVLESAHHLERQGKRATLVPVDGCGRVAPEAIEEALCDDTALVSVMLANNEVGALQPVREIAAIARERGAVVHTDAVQAVGHIPVDVDQLGIDMLSMSAHKTYGPKGAGALYIRRGTRMHAIMHGGEQEHRRRAGTENVAGIVGMGRACELAGELMPAEAERLAALRDRLAAGIQETISDAIYCGHPGERLPNNAHFCFPGANGEALLIRLDGRGIYVSSGSACSSASLQPSHVLAAMGIELALAYTSVRFSLGRETAEKDIGYALAELPRAVEQTRAAAKVEL
ncbi:MAG: aminotransferase class V-fold PLP-dependent enzyme [Armatimonadota bacterium]|jgi:cysteine desulfurase